MTARLPASILAPPANLCRLFAQVYLIAECHLLPPIPIQASWQVDYCLQVAPENDLYCQDTKADDRIVENEASLTKPQCTDIVDIWGSNGSVTIIWQVAENRGLIDKKGKNSSGKILPLLRTVQSKVDHYRIRYGAAQLQLPFNTWHLPNTETILDIKVNGNQTSLDLTDVAKDIDQGVQVCAVYNKNGGSPKFELAPVIPFKCKLCIKETVSRRLDQSNCECAKIEILTTPNFNLGVIPEIEKIQLPLLPSVNRDEPSIKGGKIAEILEFMNNTSHQKGNSATIGRNDSMKDKNVADVRYLRPKTVAPCALLSGIICEQGCSENRHRCTCLKDYHWNDRNGSCIPSQKNKAISKEKTEKEKTNPIVLFLDNNKKVTDKGQKTINIIVTQMSIIKAASLTTEKSAASPEISPDFVCILSVEQLQLAISNGVLTILSNNNKNKKTDKQHRLDSVFVEFGQAEMLNNQNLHHQMEMTERPNTDQIYSFIDSTKNFVDVIRKTENFGVFTEWPYRISLGNINKERWYGLRLCHFDSKSITEPKLFTFSTLINSTHENTNQVIPLYFDSSHPLFTDRLTETFQEKAHWSREEALARERQLRRLLLIVLPGCTLAILLTILSVFVYCNMKKIKGFFDRRRRRSFSPFQIEQLHQQHLSMVFQQQQQQHLTPTAPVNKKITMQ